MLGSSGGDDDHHEEEEDDDQDYDKSNKTLGENDSMESNDGSGSEEEEGEEEDEEEDQGFEICTPLDIIKNINYSHLLPDDYEQLQNERPLIKIVPPF